MKKKIDCLLLGYYETLIETDVKMAQSMGIRSGAAREMNYSYMQYNDEFFTISKIYNYFTKNSETILPLSTGDTFTSVISYLGTYLSRRDLSFDYVNSPRFEMKKLEEKLLEYDILTVAITTTFYVSYETVKELVSIIRKYNKNVNIIIGGPYIASTARKYEEIVVDRILKIMDGDFYINNPQGEEALVKLIKALKFNLPFNNINNIYYRDGKNFKKSNYVLEDNKLDDNMVDWSLFKDGIESKTVATRTAISCPYSCSFCAYPIYSGKYRVTKISSLEKELDSLAEIGKVESVNFIDDTFNIPLERFKDILRMIIKKKYNFKWHSYFRCQFADRETIELMKESGCEGVFLGIESGDNKILKNMNKEATIDKYKEGLKLLNEYDIISYASFIIGFPGETTDTVKSTVDFIEEYKPTFYRTNPWFCDQNTPIWEKRNEFGLSGSQYEWSHETMNSQIACNIIEDIFLSVKNSTWLPLYNFDFQGIFHLIHRGMNVKEVKKFLESFNYGIKEKIMNPDQQNISTEAYNMIKNSFKPVR